MLMLGAILLIVINLVGKDGTMSRVAGMDRGQIQVAVDDVGSKASQSAGLSTPFDDGAQPARIVRPTLADDVDADDGEVVADAEQGPEYSAPEALADHSDASPGVMDEEGFDPRVG